jgi:hypothetical protein
MSYLPPNPSTPASLDTLLGTLETRQIQIELQDRRCVAEARRHHAIGSKALFRSKMLEHRRLQAQLLQLQRYRENVHAQIDALSHHEINRTFMQAMAQRPAVDTQEVTKTMNDLHDTLNSAKELNELLGQPIEAGLDVMDEDLELDDYVGNFRRMFGDPRMDAVLGSVDGSVRFFGLTPTSMKLEGLDRHQRLIDSYKKLHVARSRVAALSS